MTNAELRNTNYEAEKPENETDTRPSFWSQTMVLFERLNFDNSAALRISYGHH
jgi:hypothetical protein